MVQRNECRRRSVGNAASKVPRVGYRIPDGRGKPRSAKVQSMKYSSQLGLPSAVPEKPLYNLVRQQGSEA